MTTAELKWAEKAERAAAAQKCPMCGDKMKELLRAEEKKSVFVWLECTKANCPGRLLQQYALA